MNARRGVIPLVIVIGSLALMAWALVTGISAALDGGGSGSLVYMVIFIAAAVLVLASLVLAITNFARGDARVLSLITIGIVVLAILAVVFWVIPVRA